MNFKQLLAGAVALILVQWLGAHVANANQVKLKAELGQSVVQAGKSGRIYLRINLEGIPLEASEERTPVNVALVLDRSGSMRGAKLAQAKEAAIMALNRLGANDFISIVAYDHNVKVPVPATRAMDHPRIEGKIAGLQAGGRTALYAGTKQGIREVKKFISDNRVNRVILLSDGLANVGPKTPEELGKLGQLAGEAGVSISTIGLGLGYNEDLMSKLAFNSDGSHSFVEKPSDLVKIFNYEFNDVMAVVAQDVIIEIRIRSGFKPVRVLGREAKIKGDRIKLRFNQLYGAHNKYVVVELDANAHSGSGEMPLADVDVSYRSMKTKTRERVSARPTVTRSANLQDVRKSINKAVMTDVTTQVANEANKKAVRLRDAGKVDDARGVLEKNASYLKQKAAELNAPALYEMEKKNRYEADNLSVRKWNKTRKMMKRQQHKSGTMQRF